MGKEPTKKDKFIGRVEIISSLYQSGDMSGEDAMQRVNWLVDEQKNGSAVDRLLKAVGLSDKKQSDGR